MKSTDIFSRSSWIWPDNGFWDLHNSYALFRKEFRLPARPARAPFFIAADQSYQLYINGRYVCRGSARGFQESWPYDEVEISKYLRRGRNVIAIRAHNPGCSNFQYVSQGFAGLLVAAKWGKFQLVSDESWKARRQTGLERSTVPTSVQLFHQEHIDLRVEDPSWMEPEFDDSSWSAKPFLRLWNSMPWYNLQERGIPQMEEKLVTPPACLGTGTGDNATGFATVRDVSQLLFTEGLAHEPAPGPGEELHCAPTGEGRTRRFLLDFGHTVVGSFGLEIEGARGGEMIDTLHVETVTMETLSPDFIPAQYCRMAFSHRLICRPGPNAHTFYHIFGFRYAMVVVRNASEKLTLRPHLRTSVYPLKVDGSFRSSDEGLNKIWEISAWTQRCCSLDGYVDTPWREQAQWWGDARIQAWNTFHLTDDDRLFRRGIECLARQRTPDGITYGHAPTMAHNCILPDFSLTWILTLWDHYWQTGSTEACAQHEETIASVLDYFRRSLHPKLKLAQADPRYWLFLDWTDLHREGCPTVLNLWLLLALERLADLRIVMKQKEEAASLRKWAGQLRRALGGLMGPSGLLHDGYDVKGKMVAATSIHSQALALLADLRPASRLAMLNEILRPYIREEKAFTAQPSSYWITYVFTVLQQNGNSAEVLEYIRKYWTPMVEHGTTWELFKPVRGDTSFSHAWSAHPIYHLMQILGGVRQTGPAWSRIIYEPHFEGDSADVVVPTPRGKIRSSWNRKGPRIEAQLSLPPGVSAEVRLPGQMPSVVTARSRWNFTELAREK